MECPNIIHVTYMIYGYGSIPINTFLSGMNIHLPAILGFTRYQGFDPSPHIYILKSSWLVCPMGSLQEALPYLEEALELCRDATILTWFAWVAWTADWEVETSRIRPKSM
jgi:hypothetical protein